jgi:membrane protein YqaA with SNARE-associated domain
MTGVPAAAGEERQPFWKGKLFRLLIVALVVGLSVSIFLLRDQFARLASVGYAGIFLVSLLGNATIILPAPSLALVFAMGSALPPLLVGLAAGVGEALGELTGYAAGYGGRAIIKDQPSYERLVTWMSRLWGITVLIPSNFLNSLFKLTRFRGQAILKDPPSYEQLVMWMGRRGGIIILILSIFPNPFFDLAGIAAGTWRYPVWRFLLLCWLGKSIKTVAVAFAGHYSLNVITPYIG